MADRLHQSLRTEVLTTEYPRGFVMRLVRLQHGRDDIVYSVHAVPNTSSSFGMQGTDVLALAGFRRQPCTYDRGECFVSEVRADFPLREFGDALVAAREKLEDARAKLEHCGIILEQPEGWGFFYGKPALPVRGDVHITPSSGHLAATVERVSEGADEIFKYVLTSLRDDRPMGWTTHYRPLHTPLSDEFERALTFIGGFARFAECPEFDFEECRWRFTHFLKGSTPFDSNAGQVHEAFRAHSVHFAPALHSLLDAHKSLDTFGKSLLPPLVTSVQKPNTAPVTLQRHPLPARFDVAISFAGPQRELAERLATILHDAGVNVFYDDFYPEQLWGKNLYEFFDDVYRKKSRYCVMFVSEEYAKRMWTNHERRSAQARALTQHGEEYILPIRTDDAELPGLPPTIAYMSIREKSIEEIGIILLRKLGKR